MNLLERNEFIKASPAIQIQSNITHLQRRIWNVLLANAYDELPNKEIHRVSVAELAEKLGFDSKNQEHLKEALEALVDHTVKWDILGKDKKQVWGVASLLASAEIENGICTYSFAPHLRYKLYNPRIYTKLNLRLQNRFMSRYALILWELCFDYFDTARDCGETPFIPIETFKELMGLEKDEYPEFKVFNRDLIKPAIKEINELTNFFIEVEQKRQGRPIAFLKFRISRLKQLSDSEPEPLYPDVEELPAIALALVQAGVARQEALKITNQGWDAVEAEVVMENYRDFAEYVNEKIALAQQATHVKNIGGFIVQAIRDNYQDAVFQTELEKRKSHEKQVILASLEAEMSEKRSALLRQAVRTEPELLEQAAEKIQSYLARERLASYNSLQEAYRDGGMVTAEINAILAEEFCQDLLAPIISAYEDEKARILTEPKR
ncbi:MAG: replication initiation protein [Candidatus Poribacteria bacterium]|nr:replication initiation protein [Candidatus Poribacteria bacterium]MDE0325492.1 replication initiation protein [Candidatus Poribacteria bacterium]